MKVQKLKKKDFEAWLSLGLLLWPKHSKKSLRKEFEKIYKSRKQIVFVCKDKDNCVGFINMSIRYDYVQGSASSPVGYIEGIFVKKEYRKKGIAKLLVKYGTQWAKEKGCEELGSDTEVENKESQNAHKKLGFKDAGKIVHFIKRI